MIPETKPAIIIASWRTGGTFLCHCLSSHPDIFCVRGEPLHYQNVWRKMSKSPKNILECVMGQHHYKVSMGKITYNQAFTDDVWPYLIEKQPHVIWLYRKNLVRQAVSLMLVKLHHKGITKQPVHTFDKSSPAGIKLNPQKVLDQIDGLQRANSGAKKRIREFKNVLLLTYDDVVGDELFSVDTLDYQAAEKITNFLGVDNVPMRSFLKRGSTRIR